MTYVIPQKYKDARYLLKSDTAWPITLNNVEYQNKYQNFYKLNRRCFNQFPSNQSLITFLIIFKLFKKELSCSMKYQIQRFWQNIWTLKAEVVLGRGAEGALNPAAEI